MLRFITGFKGYIIGGALIIVTVVGAYLYWKNLKQEIELLENEKAVAIDANESLQETLNRVQSEQERLNELRNDLQTALDDATVDKEELSRILRKHDLEKLSREKPGLIEKRINDGTKNIFDQLERDTSH